MKIVVASHNQGKLKEFNAILEEFEHEVISAFDLGIDLESFEETGSTYEENALLKARYVSTKSGLAALADDSGLTIDALPDILGVYSARFMGEATDYALKNKKICELMANETNRKGRFTSVIAFVSADQEVTFEGVIEGNIAQEIMGESGFGYDPIFVPNGFRESFAQMAFEVKNSHSHRGIALQKFKRFLEGDTYDT